MKMTFPTYEEWSEKVAEQVIDVYLINGRTIREWIEILSDELTVLDKIRAELHATAEMHDDGDYYLRDEWIDEIFDKYNAETR